jgi:2-oxoglutarate-Fe(II)-dependent oxygenase superfamily protein
VAKTTISRILVSENSLSLEECAFLIGLYDRCFKLTCRRDYNDRPLLDYYTLREAANESANRVYSLTERCKEKIALYCDIPGFFIESFFIACLLSGDSHIPHADNERREDGRWVPNHTPQRDYTGIAYLNDDFTGGELVFPDLDIVIAPRPGLLVGFPSNHEFVHAVPKVLSGNRYFLPVSFTLNSAKAMQGSLPQ